MAAVPHFSEATRLEQSEPDGRELFNPEQDSINTEEDPDRFRAAGLGEHYAGDDMALADKIYGTVKASLERIPADLQKTAQSAFADIGNTYQAFLYRDSTYGMTHHGADLSHEIAEQEAAKEISEPAAPAQEIEYDI